MVNEQELQRLQARVQVYGYMLANVFSLAYRALEMPKNEVQQFHTKMLDSMRKETFPHLGPALSDHWAGLLEEELGALVRAIESLRSGPDPQS